MSYRHKRKSYLVEIIATIVAALLAVGIGVEVSDDDDDDFQDDDRRTSQYEDDDDFEDD